MSDESSATTALGDLVRGLDEAVGEEDCGRRCAGIKATLESVVANGRDVLDPVLLHPGEGCYARRLVHLDAGGRYSVVAMVWAEGQGTPIHDHAGRWCVECVYLGRLRITAYRLESEDGRGDVRFARESVTTSGRGEAGALIPPFEHHVMENPWPETAVSIHVYAGELVECDVFIPNGDGGYRRERKTLTYTA